MSRISDDKIADLLREGLSRIPSADPGAEFDARVRAELHRPEPLWPWFRSLVLPVLTPAACSLAVTLAILISVGAARPAVSAEGPAPTGRAIALDPGQDGERSVERELDRLDRDTPSLGGFGMSRTPEDAGRDSRPLPRRRHGASRRPAMRAWRS